MKLNYTLLGANKKDINQATLKHLKFISKIKNHNNSLRAQQFVVKELELKMM